MLIVIILSVIPSAPIVPTIASGSCGLTVEPPSSLYVTFDVTAIAVTLLNGINVTVSPCLFENGPNGE